MKMTNSELHSSFLEAVAWVNRHTDPMPPDLLLKLYAYYKIANENKSQPTGEPPLISAFKVNALIQAQNMGREEAMREYIALVNKELKKL